jgi:hypothetical protein
MKKLYLKIHRVMMYGIEETIVTLCDEELVGKKLRKQGFSIWINPRFYKGRKVSQREAMRELRKATIANVVGERAVKVAIEVGLIDPDKVMRIGKVPHAQMVMMTPKF